MQKLSLNEQYECLMSAKNVIKRTWLKEYLTLRITHKKATVDMPERYRGWLYSKGVRDEYDGGPNPWLIIPEEIAAIDGDSLAAFLIKVARESPYFIDGKKA